MSTIGDKIRAERQRLGMTQADLAKRVGVRTNTVCQWERGKRLPNYELLEQLCRLLGCSPSDMLEDPREAVTEDELWELRETLRRRPEMRILFNATRDASAEDLMSVVEIVEVLKRRQG